MTLNRNAQIAEIIDKAGLVGITTGMKYDRQVGGGETVVSSRATFHFRELPEDKVRTLLHYIAARVRERNGRFQHHGKPTLTYGTILRKQKPERVVKSVEITCASVYSPELTEVCNEISRAYAPPQPIVDLLADQKIEDVLHSQVAIAGWSFGQDSFQPDKNDPRKRECVELSISLLDSTPLDAAAISEYIQSQLSRHGVAHFLSAEIEGNVSEGYRVAIRLSTDDAAPAKRVSDKLREIYFSDDETNKYGQNIRRPMHQHKLTGRTPQKG